MRPFAARSYRLTRRGQNSKQAFTRHRAFNDPLLQRASELVDGLGAETLKPEPAAQSLLRVVVDAAIVAAGITAIRVAQVSVVSLRVPGLARTCPKG